MTTLIYKYKSKENKQGLWLGEFIEGVGDEFKVRLPDDGRIQIGGKEKETNGTVARFRFSDFNDGIYEIKINIKGKLYTPKDIYIKGDKITPLSLTADGLTELEKRVNILEESLEKIKDEVSYLLRRVGNTNVINL